MRRSREDIGFKRIGYMVITNNPTAVDKVIALQHRYGLKSFKLSPDEISKMLPQMNMDGVVAAGYEPDSGYADPHLTVISMVQKAREWGLKSYQKRHVLKINAPGGIVDSVDTNRGPISTRAIWWFD